MKPLICLLILAPFICAAQNSVVWGELPKGKYEVGFKELFIFDETRNFGEKEKRPIQVLYWYPAKNTGVRMTVGDYMETNLRKTRFDVHFNDSLLNTAINFAARHGADPEAVRHLFQKKTESNQDVTIAEGPFPLVIFVPGGGRPASSAFILSEFLASHGFMVASMPNIGTNTERIDRGLTRVLTQMSDIEFLVDHFKTKPSVDPGSLALISFSSAAETIYLYQMKTGLANTLITMDGIPDTLLLKGSPYYKDLEGMELLFVRSNHGSKATAAQVHSDTSFSHVIPGSNRMVATMMTLNHPQLLSIAMLEKVVTPLTRFPSIGDAIKGHELVCLLILNHLNQQFELIDDDELYNPIRKATDSLMIIKEFKY